MTEPDPIVARAAGPLPPLERDRQVLAWLQCSPELDGEVTGYICDALLAWARYGRPYPQMALPDAGSDGDHLKVLVQILDRFDRRIAEAPTLEEKLELGRAGRLLGRAVWAARDPQGVRDSIDRELLTAMPWLAGPPAPYVFADGSVL